MKKVGSTQHRRTEKAIIDALLKISEIVQKTEASRQRQKSTNTNKRSKKTVGDGDYNELHDDEQQQQVPIVPPLMRTLDSYVSDFNQQSFHRPSNSNQTSTHRSKQDNQSLGNQGLDSNDYKDQQRSYKRHYYDTSSASDDHLQTKSVKHHASHTSFQSSETSQPV